MYIIRDVLRPFAVVVLFLFQCHPAKAATLIPMGDTWKFFRGDTDPSPGNAAAWRQRTFNDSAWERGNAAFVYGEAGFSGTDLTGMQGSYTTLYLRRTFTVANPASITDLQLRTTVDDGFVAWINGTRVASTNAAATDASV